MRLTKEQQQIIKQSVKAEFGNEANVWLFGSRVNDARRGGDIDLYIEVNSQKLDLLQAELRLYANLIKKLGDQQIDIIVYQAGMPSKQIHEQAKANGIQL